MNILILSVGTRDKVVQYFKKAFDGEGVVVASDCSELAPAIYEADKYYIVPKITDKRYLEVIFQICRDENIDGILSLIDPELSLLARHRQEFEALGVTVVGSSYELCEMSLDKYQMYRWLLSRQYHCAQSWMDKNKFYQAVADGSAKYPVFVKPARGSASISISEAKDKETVELLMAHKNNLLIQEYLHGTEIGADVYIDLISGEVVSIFTKRKLKMRAGETDKAVSFKEPRLFELIDRFVKEAGYRGQIDIDIFEIDGQYYISEVNPRFGGGYPHAYECGVDHMKLVLNNLRGIANVRKIGAYDEEIYMMKYNEVCVRKNGEDISEEKRV
ncbi:MAG: ATP-grasp domain-containing protein [Dorea sp.]|jgi:carbamoyl-phosphate synthase large subunit|nr:ATP-grasp domain-containing protein [Dorea sp.]